jgi:hypothetical protein
LDLSQFPIAPPNGSSHQHSGRKLNASQGTNFGTSWDRVEGGRPGWQAPAVIEPASRDEVDALEALIDSWLAEQLSDNPTVAAVERDRSTGERRWIARISGEEKSTFSVWFHLRQRTLHVETYMMPAPEENHAELYEHLLRRNLRFHGFAFSIGAEDGIFLIGETPVQRIDTDELDRLLGSAYEYVERCFRPAMRIGFASRYAG